MNEEENDKLVEEVYFKNKKRQLDKQRKIGIVLFVFGDICLLISTFFKNLVPDQYELIILFVGAFYSLAGLLYIILSIYSPKEGFKWLNTTEEDIIKKIKKEIKGSIALIIIGICTMIIGVVLLYLDNISYDIYIILKGVGGIFTVAGALLLNNTVPEKRLTPLIKEKLKSKDLIRKKTAKCLVVIGCIIVVLSFYPVESRALSDEMEEFRSIGFVLLIICFFLFNLKKTNKDNDILN